MFEKFPRALAFIVLLPGSAGAADWTLEPWAASRGQYQSNAALVSGEELDGGSVQVRGGFEARGSSERTSAYVEPSVDVTRFMEDELEPLDRESYFLDSGVTHSLQRAELDMRLRLAQQPAYQSELDDAIPDDPDDPLPAGGGELTVRDDEQMSVEAQPRWSYELTGRDTLSLLGRYLDVEYDEATAETSRFDYSDTRLRAEWARELGARHTAVAGVTGGEYSADSSEPGVSNDSEYVGFTLGYRWRVTELNTLEVNAGAENTDLDASAPQFCTDPADIAAGIVCDFQDEVTSFTGNVNWRIRGERYDMRFRIGSSVNPTSRGTQQLRNEGRVYVDRQFSDRLTGRLGIVGYLQESLDDQTDYETDYLTTELGVFWKLTRTLSLTADYRYLNRKSESGGATIDDFDNHIVSVGLLWEGGRL